RTALPHAKRAFAFCLLYWLVAASPSITVLPFSYIIVSPRLQIYPSPAAGILWATVAVSVAVLISNWLRQRASDTTQIPRGAMVVSLASLIAVFAIAPAVRHVRR